MAFYEQRLDLGINYGATFGPRFNTAILTQSDGQEQRRALWSQPLIVAQIGDRRVKESKLLDLIAFHATVKGAFDGFRLRDWSDYKAINQTVGTGNGTEQSWQLVKRYSISTATVTRPITKPIAAGFQVFVDGTPTATGWSLDTTTGILYTELTGAITATFEFDIPVRFEQDKIDFTFDAKGLFTLAPLTCTEIRVEPLIYPELDALPASLSEVIDLGYDFGTLGGPSFSTGIKANAAEFEKRKSYWANSLGSWDIGDRLLLGSELDYLIRLFRVCRGMAIPFRFKDWQTNSIKDVRFAEDRMSFRFDAYGGNEVIFNLGGMAIEEIQDPTEEDFRLSDFNFDLPDIPYNGYYEIYPRTINAPTEVVEYANQGATILAFLVSAKYDNGFLFPVTGYGIGYNDNGVSYQFANAPLPGGIEQLVGSGTQITVNCYNWGASGFVGGTIKWVIN